MGKRQDRRISAVDRVLIHAGGTAAGERYRRFYSHLARRRGCDQTGRFDALLKAPHEFNLKG
jgi:hypothetical protein